MVFWLKKLVSQFLMPVPLTIILLIVALFVWRKWGRWLVIAALSIISLCSNSVISHWLVAPLENNYLVNNTPIIGPCIVMILGNGHDDHLLASPAQQLSDPALKRLLEGVRQLSLGIDCKLVTSGWSGTHNEHAQAIIMAQAAESLGIDKTKITVLPDARDTIEEAQYFKLKFGDAPFRLVTSASHMTRAMQTFEKLGLAPQAAPADFRDRKAAWWLFSGQNLLTSQRALHEYYGRLWFSIKSYLTNW